MSPRLTGEHGVELDDGAVSYDRDVDAAHLRLVAAGLDQVERWQAQSQCLVDASVHDELKATLFRL